MPKANGGSDEQDERSVERKSKAADRQNEWLARKIQAEEDEHHEQASQPSKSNHEDSANEDVQKKVRVLKEDTTRPCVEDHQEQVLQGSKRNQGAQADEEAQKKLRIMEEARKRQHEPDNRETEKKRRNSELQGAKRNREEEPDAGQQLRDGQGDRS